MLGVGKENSSIGSFGSGDTTEKEKDSITSHVLHTTPSRKPFSSLKGSENKCLSSGAKRVLIKESKSHTGTGPHGTPGKMLNKETVGGRSTPSHSYMQATESSRQGLIQSPQREKRGLGSSSNKQDKGDGAGERSTPSHNYMQATESSRQSLIPSPQREKKSYGSTGHTHKQLEKGEVSAETRPSIARTPTRTHPVSSTQGML